MAVADTNTRESSFLMGWGGVVAVLAGIGIAILLMPLMRQLVLLFTRSFEALGLAGDAAVLALYWLQAIAIGVGVLIAVGGSDERIDRLRGGVANWAILLQEALIVTGVTSLWVFASATWDVHVDAFNSYGAAIELPMVALLAAMIVASIIVRLMRKHRVAEPS